MVRVSIFIDTFDCKVKLTLVSNVVTLGANLWEGGAKCLQMRLLCRVLETSR